MLRILFASITLGVFIVSPTLACDAFPNGTATHYNWWKSSNGPITFYNVTPEDANGNYEYPVHLTKTLYVVIQYDSPKTYNQLRLDIRIWSWTNCAWSEVPTLGLLNNLDACTHGVTCPIVAGKGIWAKGTLDFTQFSSIINLLKNDAPYQLETKLTDRASGDVNSVTIQARSYTTQ